MHTRTIIKDEKHVVVEECFIGVDRNKTIWLFEVKPVWDETAGIFKYPPNTSIAVRACKLNEGSAKLLLGFNYKESRLNPGTLFELVAESSQITDI